MTLARAVTPCAHTAFTLPPGITSEDAAMTRYAMLTDEPERLRAACDPIAIWSSTPFESAGGALVWERQRRNKGAIVLESRGWQFGVVFTREGER